MALETRLIIGASAYAVIKNEHRTMDVLLSPGMGARKSLSRTVEEMRERARRLNERADFIESAIERF